MKIPNRFYTIICSITIFCLTYLILVPNPILAKGYHLTILHTNDHHGHYAKFDHYPVRDVGGLAAQSTLVNIVRSEVEKSGGYTLLLSAGDINTGVPESDMFDAEPDFKIMGMLGYDAMVLGNHEFDKPLSVLMKQKEWADFPFLSANVVKKDTGETLFDPFIIKAFNGLRVGIFGLTTDETPLIVPPGNIKDLDFKDPIKTAQAILRQLRKEVDIVIALTHLGFYEQAGAGYKATGDVKLAREVRGIDVIVGGHSHTEMREPTVIGNTLIVHAGEWSKFVGRLDLKIDSDTDRITEHRFQLIPVNMKIQVEYKDKAYYMYADNGYIEDPDILEAMKPFLKKADHVLPQVVGEALVKLNGHRNLVRYQETNLGNLITDSMRAKTRADIAFQNAGGIRADIAPGVITFRDILSVQPFGNTLVLMDMRGNQIMDVLNYAAMIRPGHGAFLHVSGMRWTNNRGTAENVIIGKEPIDLNKMYRVVTNSFLASGGDGYTMFKIIPQTDTGYMDADALREYIAEIVRVEPQVEGRLSIIE